MSVIRQLAAMYASIDWEQRLYKIIKSATANKTASDGITYECYSLNGYHSTAKPYAFISTMSFIADVNLKAGKTYKIGGDFIKHNTDTTTANRAVCTYVDINGDIGPLYSSTYQSDSTHFFFNWSGGTTSSEPKRGFVKITPTTDIVKIGIGYYLSGATGYMLKDSFYIEEVEA